MALPPPHHHVYSRTRPADREILLPAHTMVTAEGNNNNSIITSSSSAGTHRRPVLTMVMVVRGEAAMMAGRRTRARLADSKRQGGALTRMLSMEEEEEEEGTSKGSEATAGGEGVSRATRALSPELHIGVFQSMVMAVGRAPCVRGRRRDPRWLSRTKYIKLL